MAGSTATAARVDGGVGKEDARAGRCVDLLVADREARVPRDDDVELLVVPGAGPSFVVLLDHQVAGRARGVGVDAEGAHAEGGAQRAPEELTVEHGHRVDVVELDGAERRGGHGVSVRRCGSGPAERRARCRRRDRALASKGCPPSLPSATPSPPSSTPWHVRGEPRGRALGRAPAGAVPVHRATSPCGPAPRSTSSARPIRTSGSASATSGAPTSPATASTPSSRRAAATSSGCS